jgi:DNA-binding transcriptional MerR regulator
MADDDRSGRGSFTLVELAEVSGVPARTIRFYIAKGLLPPPLVGGRSACYGEEHLKELDRIKTLQGQGKTLAQIAWQLGEGQKGSAESLRLGLCGSSRPPEPSAWWKYPVSKDVVVEVRCDASPWRLKQVRSLIAQMIRQLNENEEKDQAR